MGNYITTDDVWKTLGSDAYTKIRDEIVGTGNGSTTLFSLDFQNIVSGSEDLTFTNSLPSSKYSMNLDDGEITMTFTGSTLKIDATGTGGASSYNGTYYYDGDWISGGATTGLGQPTYSGSNGYLWPMQFTPWFCYIFSKTKGAVTDTPPSFASIDKGAATYNLTGSFTSGATTGTLTSSTSGEVLTADYNYADIPDSQVQSLVNEAEQELEYLTGRKFYLQTSSEYLDVELNQTRFWLTNYPLLTMSSLSANTASSVADTPAWSASTEGLGNDYLMDSLDKEVGTFEYIDNKPLSGQKRLYAIYSHGYSTIPNIVKELAILLTMRKMINSAVYRAIFKGRDNFSPARLEEIENRINQLTGMLRKQNISKI